MIKIRKLTISTFTFLLIAFSSNLVRAEEIKKNSINYEKEILQEIKNEDLIGEYTLIDKKVKIYLEENKLFISELNANFGEENELAKIGYLLFIVKGTNGLNIQFYKNKEGKFEKELVLRSLDGIKINKENFISIEEKEKTKPSDLESNMNTFRAIIETYSVVFSGTYPETSEKLKKDALNTKYEYWIDFKNPFTGKVGLGKDGSIMDFKQYKSYKPSAFLKGLVIYEALNCTPCVSYKIYGTDEKSELIKDGNGKIFYLSNEW